MSVEAWVVNVSGSAASNTGPFTASVRRQIPVPHAGNSQTNGKHYRNYLWFFWFSTARRRASPRSQGRTMRVRRVAVGAGDGGAAGIPEAMCSEPATNDGGQGPPILIDVDRDGYRLTSLDDGVFFDLDADGRRSSSHGPARSPTTCFSRWIGTATGGSTMGRSCPQPHADLSDGAHITASNGFEALKFLENSAFGRSERNEVIDASDAAFSRLLLWTDRNHNGLSEPDELQPVTAIGLQRSRPTIACRGSRIGLATSSGSAPGRVERGAGLYLRRLAGAASMRSGRGGREASPAAPLP